MRSEAGVRITAKLIRAATDTTCMGPGLRRRREPLLALQQRIASDVAVAAGRPAPRGAGRGRHLQEIDAQAYDAYSKD